MRKPHPPAAELEEVDPEGRPSTQRVFPFVAERRTPNEVDSLSVQGWILCVPDVLRVHLQGPGNSRLSLVFLRPSQLTYPIGRVCLPGGFGVAGRRAPGANKNKTSPLPNMPRLNLKLDFDPV